MNKLHQFIQMHTQEQVPHIHDHNIPHNHGESQNGVTMMSLIGLFAHQGGGISDYRSRRFVLASDNTIIGTIVVLIIGVALAHLLPAGLMGVALAVIVLSLAHLAIIVISGLAVTLFLRHQRVTSRNMMINSIPWRGRENVLDVGCGTGMMINGCAQKLTTGKAIGIDLWQQPIAGSANTLLENARAEGVADKVEYREMDARHLAFGDSSFDVVVSSFVLHHIGTQREDRVQAINQMIRVLKPGGYLSLMDIGPMMDIADSVISKANVKIIESRQTSFLRLLTAQKLA